MFIIFLDTCSTESRTWQASDLFLSPPPQCFCNSYYILLCGSKLHMWKKINYVIAKYAENCFWCLWLFDELLYKRKLTSVFIHIQRLLKTISLARYFTNYSITIFINLGLSAFKNQMCFFYPVWMKIDFQLSGLQ